MNFFRCIYLFSFLCCSCSTGVKITRIEKQVVAVEDAVKGKPDSAVIKEILPYKAELDKEMNVVIGKSCCRMSKGEPEGLLGNFVADLVMHTAMNYYVPADEGKIDFCFFNNGGLRRELPEGEITRGLIYELMPFENYLVVLTLTGANTNSLLNKMAAMGGMPVSGVKFGINDKKAVNILIQGKPLDVNRTYKIITSDYIAKGGEEFSFLANPVNYEPLFIKLRDAILEYIIAENKKGNILTPVTDGRIYYEK